ncbi:uncharacterized protein LAESUDRAFT_663471, partial [Laetiporus sulphureus 93-53]
LQALSTHSGVETLLIAVQTNFKFYSNPLIFYSNQRLVDYLEMMMKTSVRNYAVRIEGFTISDIEGMLYILYAYPVPVCITSPCWCISTHACLDKVLPVPIKCMIYQNFNENITAKYHHAIINYPLKKFCYPSDVGSKSELELLLWAWESGVTF